MEQVFYKNFLHLNMQAELVRASGGAIASSCLLGVPLGHNSSFLQGPAFAPPRIREAIWCGSTNSTTEAGQGSLCSSKHCLTVNCVCVCVRRRICCIVICFELNNSQGIHVLLINWVFINYACEGPCLVTKRFRIRAQLTICYEEMGLGLQY